jgi:hypothetical protein
MTTAAQLRGARQQLWRELRSVRERICRHSVTVTERYAHLRPDLFAQRDLATIALDLRAGGADPVHLGHDWRTVRGEVAYVPEGPWRNWQTRLREQAPARPALPRDRTTPPTSQACPCDRTCW